MCRSKENIVQDAVIVNAVRTPVGKRNGGLSQIHPVDLSAHVLNALIGRAGIDPGLVDDVIWGCVSQVGEQTGDISRNAVLAAGWPLRVPGVTIDRQCGSSQQSVSFAAASVVAGYYDLVVAGGVESMSMVPIGTSALGKSTLGEGFREHFGDVVPHQGVGAEMIAERWGLSRTQLDEFSLGSHEKAAAAQDNGLFDAEIAAVTTASGDNVASDEGVRRGGTLESLARLKPAFTPDGVVTAGSSSQISDGASALLITSSAKAKELGLDPIARVHTAVVEADDPIIMLTGPIPATAKVLQRSGLSIADIGVFEVNEAFASVALAWLKETGAPEDLLNPNGGAIALGHPLGASGTRIMTTMLHHMQRNNIRYGLQTMCEGGGQANATILELL
jgi:acetyl-CoA acyltransferase